MPVVPENVRSTNLLLNDAVYAAEAIRMLRKF
jgi:hypothetical protein